MVEGDVRENTRLPKLEQDVQNISKFQPPPLLTLLPPRAKQINRLKVRGQRQWQSGGQQQAKLTCEQKPKNTHTNQKIQQTVASEESEDGTSGRLSKHWRTHFLSPRDDLYLPICWMPS